MKRTFAQAAFAAALLLGPAQAAYANGINSPAGVDVAIGAGGHAGVITISAAGNIVAVGAQALPATFGVTGQVQSTGGIQIGTDTVCDSTSAGTLSYDSTNKKVQFCDGSKFQNEGDRGRQLQSAEQNGGHENRQ